MSEAGTFAFLSGGDVDLVLNHVAETPSEPTFTEIVWEVDDVVAACGDLLDRGCRSRSI